MKTRIKILVLMIMILNIIPIYSYDCDSLMNYHSKVLGRITSDYKYFGYPPTYFRVDSLTEVIPCYYKYAEKLPYIDFENSKFDTIPNDFYDVKGIETIEINNIYRMDPGIILSKLHKFKRFKELFIYSTDINNSNIKLNDSTYKIYISDCKINSFPGENDTIYKVKECSINHSDLSELSDKICLMTELVSLCIWDCKITTVPDCLFKMKIEDLSLMHNQLENPIEILLKISEMKTLKGLAFSSSKINYIPKEIFNLEDLEYLLLLLDDISELPKEISKLKKLKELAIDNIKLSCIIENIKLLPETLETFQIVSDSFIDEEKEELERLLPKVKIHYYLPYNFNKND